MDAYELRVTNELEEALFADRLQLVAVAHPSGVDVFPPPDCDRTAERRPFAAARRSSAAVRRSAATDDRGRDVPDRIAALDRRAVDGFELAPIRGYARRAHADARSRRRAARRPRAAPARPAGPTTRSRATTSPRTRPGWRSCRRCCRCATRAGRLADDRARDRAAHRPAANDRARSHRRDSEEQPKGLRYRRPNAQSPSQSSSLASPSPSSSSSVSSGTLSSRAALHGCPVIVDRSPHRHDGARLPGSDPRRHVGCRAVRKRSRSIRSTRRCHPADFPRKSRAAASRCRPTTTRVFRRRRRGRRCPGATPGSATCDRCCECPTINSSSRRPATRSRSHSTRRGCRRSVRDGSGRSC